MWSGLKENIGTAEVLTVDQLYLELAVIPPSPYPSLPLLPSSSFSPCPSVPLLPSSPFLPPVSFTSFTPAHLASAAAHLLSLELAVIPPSPYPSLPLLPSSPFLPCPSLSLLPSSLFLPPVSFTPAHLSSAAAHLLSLAVISPSPCPSPSTFKSPLSMSSVRSK